MSAMLIRKSGGHRPDRANFDRPVFSTRNPRRDFRRLVQILCVDQVVAAELLASFGEWAVGCRALAVAHPNCGRRLGRLKGGAALVVTALGDSFSEGAVIGHHRGGGGC